MCRSIRSALTVVLLLLQGPASATYLTQYISGVIVGGTDGAGIIASPDSSLVGLDYSAVLQYNLSSSQFTCSSNEYDSGCYTQVGGPVTDAGRFTFTANGRTIKVDTSEFSYYSLGDFPGTVNYPAGRQMQTEVRGGSFFGGVSTFSIIELRHQLRLSDDSSGFNYSGLTSPFIGNALGGEDELDYARFGQVGGFGELLLDPKHLVSIVSDKAPPLPSGSDEPTPPSKPDQPSDAAFGLKKEELKSISKVLGPAMSTLSKALDIAAILEGGTENIGKNVAKYMVEKTYEAAMDNAIARWRPRDPLGKFYEAARDIIQEGKVLPAVLSLMSDFADEDARMLHEIANDPADASFKSVYYPDALEIDYPGLSTISNAGLYSNALKDMATYHADLLGLLTATERYDGATAANDTEGRALQLDAFNLYLGRSGLDAGRIKDDLIALAGIWPSIDTSGFGADPGKAVADAFAMQCGTSLPSIFAANLESAGLTFVPSGLDVCTAPTKIDVPDLKATFLEPSAELTDFAAAAAAPELDVWLLMLVGFGLVGRALRKRPVQNAEDLIC